VYGIVLILVIASLWMTFTKANQPGWAAIIPFYNIYIMCKVAGRPGYWWALISFIPFVNIVLLIILYIDIAKSFGHGGGFAVGMIFLPMIFFPILGFGSSKYQGPYAAKGTGGGMAGGGMGGGMAGGGMGGGTPPPPPPPAAPMPPAPPAPTA
jgi:hypothetical protein